ncbi:MAG: amino acid permease [Phycisphaerales bacterium]|nr:amino acid permease [Phycisphaerales bacterium]
MFVSQKRPRVLGWYHAGPLLFGDWGTSRLYVLGLAFFYTGHASPLYLTAMSVLMITVAWAYTVICRCFPEGGGVYAAARQIHPLLAVVGATLLLCDYTVTTALSIVDGMHYFGVPHEMVLAIAITSIIGLGLVNWLGAKSAGRLALIIAIGALLTSAIIAVLCIPFVKAGLSSFSLESTRGVSPWGQWESFVRIVLALSGVEAVANMTGLMKPPVARTAKRTIWPVLAEVVLLNLIFGIALTGLPSLVDVHTPEAMTLVPGAPIPPETLEYRDTAMKVLAVESGQKWFGESTGYYLGIGAAVIYGLLLLSAGNTAIMATVAVLYSMAQDRELPRPLTRLNYSGVPKFGLLLAVVLPIGVLLVNHDIGALADLYAVGVCGAITISVGSCAINRALPIKRWERAALYAIAIFMLAIELTIIVGKWHATLFAVSLIAAVLVARWFMLRQRRAQELGIPEPVTGWLAEVRRDPVNLDPNKPRIMLAARGRSQAEFATDLARKRGAILFAIYVRTLRVIDIGSRQVPKIEDDREAQESLGSVAVLASQLRVPFVPIYVTSSEIAEEILDYTVTFGCDTLVLGKSRRRWFSRAVEGDVVKQIAANLPSEVALITREANPYIPGREPVPDRAGTGADGTEPPPT